MRDLRITLIQSDIHWHQPEANLAGFEEMIWSVEQDTDLIVLPEMFNTGFTMEAREHAELINGRTFKWMKNMARQTGAVITGSMITSERQELYNRLFWMKPDGSWSSYDKRHLFRITGENKVFTAGEKILIEELKGWRICPLICYDLRFPEWGRNRFQPEKEELSCDMIIYLANWPESRINAWDTLLKARAMENSAFIAGLNRIGKDGNGISYNGHSSVYGPKGESYAEIVADPFVKTIDLSLDYLRQYREKFPVHLDWDQFELKT